MYTTKAEFTSLKEQEHLPTKTMENLHDSVTVQVNGLVQLNDSQSGTTFALICTVDSIHYIIGTLLYFKVCY